MQRLTKSEAAFTLLELLITLIVIAILVVLITPVVSAGFEKSRSLKCVANLHQIGITLNLYLNDHDQRMPAITDDRIDLILEPYLENNRMIFICPSDPAHSNRTDSSYRWNSALNGQLSTSLKFSLGTSTIENPHDIIILCDKTSWHHNQPELGKYNQAGRSNFLYADGSAGNHPLTLPK